MPRKKVPQPPRSAPYRARGTGGLYFDEKRDRWIGVVTVAGRRRKVSAATKTDAQAKLSKVSAAKATGAPVDDRAHTVAKAVATFIDKGMPTKRRASRPPSPSTKAVYDWCAELITDHLGPIRLVNLTVEDVEAMLGRLHADDLSMATLRKVRGTLQNAIALAIKRGKISYNVALHAHIPDEARPTQSRNALQPESARRLLEALRAEPDGLLFGLSLRLGLRPGEAAAVSWADVDGDVLHVRRGRRMVNGRPTIVDDLKTTGSERSIELPLDVADWISEHRRQTFGDVVPLRLDGVLVFPTPAGNPRNPANDRRRLADICDRTGVLVVRPNELRHSCASLLSDMGVPNEHIADLLGHTSTRMVEMTYRHRLRPVVDVAARTDWTTAAGR